MSEENSIVDEVRQAREAILAEYNGDLDALVKALQRRTEEAARSGHQVVALPLPTSSEPAKKAG